MKASQKRLFFESDGGFSTVGMALALLIALSLILSSMQVYKLRSISASVQNVADACALAAEKQVASFYIVASICDSAIFTLTLAGSATVGIGIVAACVPPAQGISAQLIDAGKNILQARRSFAQACAEGLNHLQTLLPIFAALDAAAVAQANSRQTSSYLSIALLVPFEGASIQDAMHHEEDDALEALDEEHATITQAALEAEEAAQKANEYKRAAYMADCGSAPAYCMYERAKQLAALDGSSNPFYSSADTWSFSAAYNRARQYYQQRLAIEAPEDSSLDAQIRSAIRYQFYRYALDCFAQGYVHETQDSFDASFPILPRNTSELRETRLYTDELWPVSQDEEGNSILHAWDACPGALEYGVSALGSLAQAEISNWPICASCAFGATSVGKVASASSSINNGFEYHYRIVAHNAALYQQERSVQDKASQNVKEPVSRVFEKVKELLSSANNYRLNVQAPGSFGAIAFCIDTAGVPASGIVQNNLIQTQAVLGTRAAISAASLVGDDSSEEENVISSFLDGLFSNASMGSVPGTAFDIWSGFLVGYTQGHNALIQSVEQALNSLPLVGASGLGTWAATQLKGLINLAGLTPPDITSYKPALVNSLYVASADTSALGQGIVGAKQLAAQAYGGIAQDPLSALISVSGGQLLSHYESWDATFVVATIKLFDGSVSLPIEITLPPALKDSGKSMIELLLERLLVDTGQMVEVRRWE